MAAHNTALDTADASSGSIRAFNGQVLRGQAVDGKDVRGARAHGRRIFLVSLVRHSSAYVLAQAAIHEKTNEITAVPLLLAGRDLSGTVTTMDALLTQRTLAQQIVDQNGHYLMIVSPAYARLWLNSFKCRRPWLGQASYRSTGSKRRHTAGWNNALWSAVSP